MADVRRRGARSRIAGVTGRGASRGVAWFVSIRRRRLPTSFAGDAAGVGWGAQGAAFWDQAPTSLAGGLSPAAVRSPGRQWTAGALGQGLSPEPAGGGGGGPAAVAGEEAVGAGGASGAAGGSAGAVGGDAAGEGVDGEELNEQEENEMICTICFMDLREDPHESMLCGHTYHTACIDAMLEHDANSGSGCLSREYCCVLKCIKPPWTNESVTAQAAALDAAALAVATAAARGVGQFAPAAAPAAAPPAAAIAAPVAAAATADRVPPLIANPAALAAVQQDILDLLDGGGEPSIEPSIDPALLETPATLAALQEELDSLGLGPPSPEGEGPHDVVPDSAVAATLSARNDDHAAGLGD